MNEKELQAEVPITPQIAQPIVDPVSKTPYHTHNGIDSPQIDSSDVLGGSAASVACRAYRNASQVLNTGSGTRIQLNVTNWDTNSMLGSNKINIPEDGYYVITAQVMFDSAESGKVYSAYINDASGQIATAQSHASNTSQITVYISDVRYCAAGSYLELYAYHNSSGNVNLYYGSVASYISVIKI